LGRLPKSRDKQRAQVTQIGDRVLIRPLDGAGALNSLTASADGLIVGADSQGTRVKVRLLKDREAVRRQVVIAGCDPSMFLAAEHLKRNYKETLIPCLMGNANALAALTRGVVHAAGVHLADECSEPSRLTARMRALAGVDCTVITFAHWEEGIIVRRGNSKKIRTVADLTRPAVKIINREKGSGARRLLDRKLQSGGIPSARVKGYEDEVSSHLELASRIRAGLADAGIGVRSAAAICGLEFVPLQRERYDLLIPKRHYESLSGMKVFLDTIVSKRFRDEIEALGGYDTRDSGKIIDLRR
jgi:molybdate-binding protein